MLVKMKKNMKNRIRTKVKKRGRYGKEKVVR
jgi:hypothetical protein